MHARTNLASNKNFKLVKILATNAALAFTLLGSAGVAYAAECTADQTKSCSKDVSIVGKKKLSISVGCYGVEKGVWRLSKVGTGSFLRYGNNTILGGPVRFTTIAKNTRDLTKTTEYESYTTAGVSAYCHNPKHQVRVKISATNN